MTMKKIRALMAEVPGRCDRVRCAVCGREVSVSSTGKIREHKAQAGDSKLCRASGFARGAPDIKRIAEEEAQAKALGWAKKGTLSEALRERDEALRERDDALRERERELDALRERERELADARGQVQLLEGRAARVAEAAQAREREAYVEGYAEGYAEGEGLVMIIWGPRKRQNA